MRFILILLILMLEVSVSLFANSYDSEFAIKLVSLINDYSNENVGELIISSNTESRWYRYFPVSTVDGIAGLRTFEAGERVKVFNVLDWKQIDRNLGGGTLDGVWYLVGDCEWLPASAGQYRTSYGREYLCSDEWFTNTGSVDFNTLCVLIHSFRNNRFKERDIQIIWAAAQRYGINPLVILCKLEQEQSLVANNNTNRYEYRLARAMGYGIYVKDNYGFERQVFRGTACLKRRMAEYRDGVILQIAPEPSVKPANAATYALYRYCPHYGETFDNVKGKKHYALRWAGNRVFVNMQLFFRAKYFILSQKGCSEAMPMVK